MCVCMLKQQQSPVHSRLGWRYLTLNACMNVFSQQCNGCWKEAVDANAMWSKVLLVIGWVPSPESVQDGVGL